MLTWQQTFKTIPGQKTVAAMSTFGITAANIDPPQQWSIPLKTVSEQKSNVKHEFASAY
jgi:hypothetical protein